MTPKRRRLTMVGLGLLMVAAATTLALNAFEDTLVFFLQSFRFDEGGN